MNKQEDELTINITSVDSLFEALNNILQNVENQIQSPYYHSDNYIEFLILQ